MAVIAVKSWIVFLRHFQEVEVIKDTSSDDIEQILSIKYQHSCLDDSSNNLFRHKSTK